MEKYEADVSAVPAAMPTRRAKQAKSYIASGEEMPLKCSTANGKVYFAVRIDRAKARKAAMGRILMLGRRLCLLVAITFSMGAAPAPQQPVAVRAPQFTVETGWLKMPTDLVYGEVAAVDVDKQDQLWVLQRPKTARPGPGQHAAPPIMIFDRHGVYLRGFGGPGQGYDWPANEHSLAVDALGRAWITGNGRSDPKTADDMLLTFDSAGRFVRQIGRPGGTRGDEDVDNLSAPADVFVDLGHHEVYVADGYGNRRVIVFDSETGRFKRMWSAFGAVPPAVPAPPMREPGKAFTPETGEGPPGFNGVHGVELSRDGLVYVSDRNNQRIQIFTRGGRYLRQVFIDRNQASPQTSSGMAFSADAAQRFLYVADFGNSKVLILDRRTLKVIGEVGGKGEAPGQFQGPHLMATDSRGNLYVAEVPGRRLQRFTLKAN
jgi:DNA-binding beta-propeller fold protein YncE